MTTKLNRLKAEYAKNADRIASLQAKNKRIMQQVEKLESETILGMVREHHLTLEELAEFLQARKTNPLPAAPTPKQTHETEEKTLEKT